MDDTKSFSQMDDTKVLNKKLSQNGQKMINNYTILSEIGRGVHGKVKLAVDPSGTHWAIKIVHKRAKRSFHSKLSALALNTDINTINLMNIKREIAILKKCRHPNVVYLHQVIDDPHNEKIYLVLEYLPGGEIDWEGGLDMVRTRHIFRDVVAGLQYLHCQGIVHRDIKPANLLADARGTVKIADFGVSVFLGRPTVSKSGLDLQGSIETELNRTAGSPAFLAPELCSIGEDFDALDVATSNLTSENLVVPNPELNTLPGAAIDIWALGVTLYCLVFGKVPFLADNEFELFKKISQKPLEFPHSIPTDLQDILNGMLKKNESNRMTIRDIRFHIWTTADLDELARLKWLAETDLVQPVPITENDVSSAVGTLQKLKNQIRKLSSSIQSLNFGFGRKASSPDANDKQTARKLSGSLHTISGRKQSMPKNQPNEAELVEGESPNNLYSETWVRWENRNPADLELQRIADWADEHKDG